MQYLPERFKMMKQQGPIAQQLQKIQANGHQPALNGKKLFPPRSSKVIFIISLLTLILTSGLYIIWLMHQGQFPFLRVDEGEYWWSNVVTMTIYVIIIGIIIGYHPRFSKTSGFVEFDDKGKKKVKTFWNWMELLIVPVILAAIAFSFNFLQLQLSTAQHESDQKITNDQYINNQAIASDQQKGEILSKYLDDTTDLMLNHNLRNSKPGDEVRIIARAKTLTALKGLDGERKGQILLFLYEAGLINDKDTIVSLQGGDLRHVNLPHSNLSGINLNETDLSATVMDGSNLRNADLKNAVIDSASFSSVDFSNADISTTSNVNISTNPSNTKEFYYNTDLSKAILTNASLENRQLYAYLDYADFTGANIKNTQFLCDLVHFEGCTFLEGAKITKQQLTQIKYNIATGVIMPDGSSYENPHQGATGSAGG